MAMAHSACAPIFWAHSENSDGLTNGTVTFVCLNGRAFGLTAGHVAEACDKYLADTGKLVLLGSTTFGAVDATFTYHPQYPDVDLAICNFDESMVEQIRVLPLNVLGCPIPLPVNGQNAALGGFPGQDRFNRNTEVDFDFFYFDGNVFQTEGPQIQITVKLADATPLNCPPLSDPIKMGGMSGGPVFAYFERQSEAHLALVGIITDGFDMYETVFGTSLSSLTSTGSFA